MRERVQRFIKQPIDANFGYGVGSGRTDPYGRGNGFGCGDRPRINYGERYGFKVYDDYGYGYGDGCGIEKIDGYEVYQIGENQAIAEAVYGNVVRCAILHNDLTLEYGYTVRTGKYFAFGETLKKAMYELADKIMRGQDWRD